MKSLLKLAGLCALAFGVAVSCTDIIDLFDKELAAPTELAAIDATPTSATLTWAGVEKADQYRIRINNGALIIVDTNIYRATGLAPETTYTWAVQAVWRDVVSPWSADAVFTTPPGEVPPVELTVPANLIATNVTYNTATLNWDAVAGAVGYDLVFADREPMTLEATTYALNNLEVETTYEWTVRAVAVDGRVSEWAPMANFTTPAPVVYTVAPTSCTYYGDFFGAGTSNFTIRFQSADLTNGLSLGLELITEAIDDGPTVQWLNIPEATYLYRTGTVPPTVMLGTSLTSVTEYVNGSAITRTATGGTYTVTGDMDGYRMVWDIEVNGRPNVQAVFEGSFSIPNPYWVPEPVYHDFGRIPMRDNEISFYPDAFGTGQSDAYVLQGMGDGVYVVDDYVYGTGWFIANVQFHAPVNTGMPIPDGEYIIGNSNDPGYVLAGYVNAAGAPVGLWAHRLDNDVMVSDMLKTGTVTSTLVDGAYEIVINAVDDAGYEIYTGTIFSTAEPTGVASRPYTVNRVNTAPDPRILMKEKEL